MLGRSLSRNSGEVAKWGVGGKTFLQLMTISGRNRREERHGACARYSPISSLLLSFRPYVRKFPLKIEARVQKTSPPVLSASLNKSFDLRGALLRSDDSNWIAVRAISYFSFAFSTEVKIKFLALTATELQVVKISATREIEQRIQELPPGFPLSQRDSIYEHG